MQARGEWTCLTNFCNVIKCCEEQESGGKHCLFYFMDISATNAYIVHKEGTEGRLTQASDSV